MIRHLTNAPRHGDNLLAATTDACASRLEFFVTTQDESDTPTVDKLQIRAGWC